MQLEPKKNPVVSIIMPTYNRGTFLPRTLQCILEQTFTNFELIIIDDYSTDNTSKILEEVTQTDVRIKCIRNETNLKVAHSLNKGLLLASGKYIARADDDDPWIDRDKLKKQVEFLEKNQGYVLIGTGAVVVDEKRKELFRYRVPVSDILIRKKMLFGSQFIHPSVVFQKSILEKTGIYNELIGDAEDWDLWLRMGIYGKLANLPTYSIERHYGKRGLSVKNRKNISKARLQLIKKYKKQYPHFIFAYFFNSLQYLYAFFLYLKIVDNFLFKLKRNFLAK